MKPSQESYVPSHPELFLVDFRTGEFNSSLIAQKDYHAGDHIVSLEGITKDTKAYTSVQCGPGPEDHIELNCDLVYVNHSCEPNVTFDLSSSDPSKWHVRALKDIASGSSLTFFYPSTEWDMDQPFECQCDMPTCIGRIQGARYLSETAFATRGYINSWILALVAMRDTPTRRVGGKVCAECGYGFSAQGDLGRCGCRPGGQDRQLFPFLE